MHTRAHHTVGLLFAAGLGLAAAAVAQADTVTYQASGQISQADNSAQLPSALTGAAIGGALTLNFTIDTNAPGTLNGPGDEVYTPAVLAQTATIGSGSVNLAVGDALDSVEIFNNAPSGGAYTSGYQLLTVGSAPANFTGTVPSVLLTTESLSPSPQTLYSGASLSNAPLPASASALASSGLDSIVLLFDSFVNGIFQSSSDIVVGQDVSVSREGGTVSAPELDPASAGSVLTLLFGSLIVIAGRRPKAAR